MNVDAILGKLNDRQVAYLLIGGMNFTLRHQPITTLDVDVWIEDSEENRRRCERALAELGAEWGRTDYDWGSVANKPMGWLDAQGVFCLNTPFGALDVFRAVPGLSSWKDSRTTAVTAVTSAGTPFFGISDRDMLECQLALAPGQEKQDRISYLRNLLQASNG